MTERMRDLTIRIDDESIRFYSITVDPEFDTPEILDEYRSKTTSDVRWQFATGDYREIRSLVESGFKLGIATSEDPREPIIHSTRFVLVDSEGRIRGFYESTSKDALDALVADAKSLL